MSNPAFNIALCLPFGELWAVPYGIELETKPSLLPPNTTPLERALEQTMATFEPPSDIAKLWNAATCPVDFLPYLAWAVSVDEWDHTWSEERKRAVIAESRAVHQHKGTPSAIRRILIALGQPDAEIIERCDFIKYNGKAKHNGMNRHRGAAGWATFRIVLKRAITIDQAIQIRRAIDGVKRNCVELVAIDFRKAYLRHNGQAKYNGTYTHGVVTAKL